MKRIILTAGVALLAAACGPTETNLECGAGVAADIQEASYCVYKQELIIEGFECPPGLNRHDLEDVGLTVCGENPMRPPLEHIEELKEQYAAPQCTDVNAFMCAAGQVRVNAASCQSAGASCTLATETCGGASVGCLDVPRSCDTAVGTPAACPDGTTEVAECADASDCQIVWGSNDQCGTYKFCKSAGTACMMDAPTCGETQVLIDATTCEALGAECSEVTACGETVRCLDIPTDCDLNIGTPATCPDGTTEVTTCTDAATCQLARGSGDQCSDYKLCQGERARQTCGTIAGIECFSGAQACVDIPNDGCDLTSGGGADCEGVCLPDSEALRGFLTDGCGPVDNPNVRLRVYQDLTLPVDCSFPNTTAFREVSLDVGSVEDIVTGVDYTGDPNNLEVTECTGPGMCQSVGTFSIFFDQVGSLYRGIYKITDGQGQETTGIMMLRGCGGGRPLCG